MYRQIGYRVEIFLSVGMSLPYVFIQAANFLMANPGREFLTGVCIGFNRELDKAFKKTQDKLYENHYLRTN